jgi:hypothetical protein
MEDQELLIPPPTQPSPVSEPPPPPTSLPVPAAPALAVGAFNGDGDFAGSAKMLTNPDGAVVVSGGAGVGCDQSRDFGNNYDQNRGQVSDGVGGASGDRLETLLMAPKPTQTTCCQVNNDDDDEDDNGDGTVGRGGDGGGRVGAVCSNITDNVMIGHGNESEIEKDVESDDDNMSNRNAGSSSYNNNSKSNNNIVNAETAMERVSVVTEPSNDLSPRQPTPPVQTLADPPSPVLSSSALSSSSSSLSALLSLPPLPSSITTPAAVLSSPHPSLLSGLSSSSAFTVCPTQTARHSFSPSLTTGTVTATGITTGAGIVTNDRNTHNGNQNGSSNGSRTSGSRKPVVGSNNNQSTSGSNSDASRDSDDDNSGRGSGDDNGDDGSGNRGGNAINAHDHTNSSHTNQRVMNPNQYSEREEQNQEMSQEEGVVDSSDGEADDFAGWVVLDRRTIRPD